jgi:hypothetical protein
MRKNLAAQILGRLGGRARMEALSADQLADLGRKGGEARARSLTPERRSEIARKAVQARIRKQLKQAKKASKG